MRRLCWHGEPVKNEFGYSIFRENEEKPLWWYNYFCLQDATLTGILPSIKITNNEHSFVIANMHGIGWLKLKHGGWPNTVHYSLPLDSFRPINGKGDSHFAIRSFDEEGYVEYKNESDKWFKYRYGDTEEYKRSQELKKMIINP